MPAEPASPCIRQCCLDQNDICLGCQRTLSEILAWHGMNAEQKQALIGELAERRARKQEATAATRPQRIFLGLDMTDAVRQRLHLEAENYRTIMPSPDWRWIAPARGARSGPSRCTRRWGRCSRWPWPRC